MKEKIPEMMQRWHSNYQQISPICRYLIQTIHYNTFDFPDFLIVAHALIFDKRLPPTFVTFLKKMSFYAFFIKKY